MVKQMFKINNKTESMEDRYYLTYCLFYALGLLAVVHSHFFIIATDYWMYKFRDPNHENYTSENRTGLQAEFAADFSIVSTASNIAFVILTLLVIRRLLSRVRRIATSLCGVAAMFALTVIFVELDTDSWQLGFFILTLMMGFGLTAFCAMALVSTIELVNTKFPPEYTAAVLSGQSVCGIFSALVQIVCLSIGASSQTTGLIYFLVGLVVVLMVLMYLLYVSKNSDFFMYYVNKKSGVKMQKISRGGLIMVLKKIKFYMISMIVVVGGTVVVHPGVTSLIVSTGKDNDGHLWHDKFYVPVVTFLFHNVFDLFGRELAAKIKKPRNAKIILAVAIIRIIFVPLFMFCNAQPRSHLPVIFDNDYAYLIFQVIFSFSHGYLINLCVIVTPTITPKEEQTIAIIILVAFMIVGIGACSFLSTILVKEL